MELAAGDESSDGEDSFHDASAADPDPAPTLVSKLNANMKQGHSLTGSDVVGFNGDGNGDDILAGCWAIPDFTAFPVRSASYFKDCAKTPARICMFKCVGVDMFHTASLIEKEGNSDHIARYLPRVRDLGAEDNAVLAIVNMQLPAS